MATAPAFQTLISILNRLNRDDITPESIVEDIFPDIQTAIPSITSLKLLQREGDTLRLWHDEQALDTSELPLHQQLLTEGTVQQSDTLLLLHSKPKPECSVRLKYR